MLSFQKEQTTAPAINPQADDATAQQDGLTQEQDYLTVASHGKKLQQSTIILALLFLFGGAGVYFMIKKTVPAAANAAPSQDQVQLDAALAQLKNMETEMNSEMDSVVGRFHDFDKVDQIGVDELKKNPFKREISGVQEETVAEAEAQDELKELQAEARRQAASLELWSITSTPKGNCCMINNKLLYIGDTINALTVKQINKKSVTLDYNGFPVELKMSE
ncbi:MAG: hypothetical protein ACYSUT_05645 [Planctomycetota bacterium]|jgi:hypothetical protein